MSFPVLLAGGGAVRRFIFCKDEIFSRGKFCSLYILQICLAPALRQVVTKVHFLFSHGPRKSLKRSCPSPNAHLPEREAWNCGSSPRVLLVGYQLYRAWTPSLNLDSGAEKEREKSKQRLSQSCSKGWAGLRRCIKKLPSRSKWEICSLVTRTAGYPSQLRPVLWYREQLGRVSAHFTHRTLYHIQTLETGDLNEHVPTDLQVKQHVLCLQPT